MEYDKAIEEETGIFVFKNAFSKELCEKTIRLFKESKNTHKGRLSSGYKPQTKVSTDWHIDNEEINRTFEKLFVLSLNSVNKAYPHLKQVHTIFTGLQMQESKVGKGKFVPHTDCNYGQAQTRVLAYIYYLNDVEEGGETKFKYQNINIKPEEGMLVIFPCTWKYLHEGVVPLSNDKYIITTFGAAG